MSDESRLVAIHGVSPVASQKTKNEQGQERVSVVIAGFSCRQSVGTQRRAETQRVLIQLFAFSNGSGL
jgi:hypothetical protein